MTTPTLKKVLRTSVLMVLGCLVCTGRAQAANAADDTLVLRDGWSLISSANLADTGETISSPGYAAGGQWMKAVVPGTVLRTYVQAGVYPDPYVGLNNKFAGNPKPQIPDASLPGSPFTFAHWYRTGFQVPAAFKGKTVWLKFDGTHWRATYYLNGKTLGTVTGAYQRGIFNVTGLLQDGTNALAVKIEPLPVPGKPKGSGCGGDRQIGSTPAAIYANIGWDFTFVDGVRDRCIGIIRDVTLYATGPVDIRDPFISTEGIPTAESANLNFRTLLVNGSDKAQAGKLRVEFGDQQLIQDLKLEPNETRDLKLGHKELAALIYKNPKLWWPAGRGEPHLYPLKVSFQTSSGESTRVDRRFGIRSIENRPEKGQWVCWVNGQRIFLAGGSWVQDAMQRQTPEREATQVRLIRDAGLNWLRLWSPSGPLGDEFFDACDTYGVMVWAEGNLGCQVVCPRDNADYVKITFDNWADYVLRIRNHACLFNYVGCNEGRDIRGMDEIVKTHDGTRPYSPSSQDLGQRGSPYRWLGLKGFYDYTNTDMYGAGPMGLFGGFCNESGGPALPVAETLRELIPADQAFPGGRELVDYLDGGGFHRMFEFIQGLSRFGDTGKPDMAGRTGIDNVAFKGQMLNAQAYRAMGEQWQRNKWDVNGRFATGYALWTVNNTHPQICARIYDYSLEANSALYYLGHANKPLHVQFNYKENDVTAVNNSFVPAANLKVKAEIRKLDWTLAWSGEASLESQPAESAKTGLVKVPTAAEIKLAEVHFIRCQLLNQKNEVLDDTFYWRTGDDAAFGVEGNFRGLNQMPGSSLSVKTKTENKDGKPVIQVTLENQTKQLAFFTRVKVLDAAKKLVRPCFYSDNYFSVPPGDTKTMEIECPPTLAGEPVVVVEGWNLGILALGANAQGKTPAVPVPEFNLADQQPPMALPATASSSDNADRGPEKAVDGDDTTRWSSAFTDQEWICLDLGKTKTISGIELLWEVAFGKEYKIQVSADGNTWTDAFVQTAGKGGRESIVFKDKQECRYVRMLGSKRATQYGYSLWEIRPR